MHSHIIFMNRKIEVYHSVKRKNVKTPSAVYIFDIQLHCLNLNFFEIKIIAAFL